ncbi:nucleotidyl transferase AbiEii/AbiGii toxin family protein [Adhaeribacter aquaticus]|uniref:nucleotidyl transferase AbiEii/AbiGii toxin family protein n=1 Tax=Adhaeribacter aquaticus TaxID=299567 RepID=UPI000408470C|nr:nucleotidyl transferase AbiEii/AbiGii toxin family protein [Adhaeribacter aquaticus]
MNLHQNPEVFQDAITAAAQALNIREIFIRKDYWVTLVLYRLAHSPYVNQAIFKGGTSLSKAYNLIERFSEDIDLAINATESMTGNQVRSLLSKIGKEITKDLSEVPGDPVTSKGSRFRKTVHDYGAPADAAFGQASNTILLEINAFASPNPHQHLPVSSYIGQFLAQRNLFEFIRQYTLQPFEVNVVSLERTFTEKVMALVRASYGPDPMTDLRLKIRHVYDLNALLKQPKINSFLNSQAFFTSLQAVQVDDARSSEFQGVWSSEPLREYLLFQDPLKSWPFLLPTYMGEFKSLVYGALPPQEEILNSLAQIAARLKNFDA